MSLGRQLILLLVLTAVLMFVGTLAVSTYHARAYLSAQLGNHAQDTATALGLSLSQPMLAGDVVLAERIIDAMFSSGYYRAIDLQSLDGQTLVTRRQPIRVEGVPAWLLRYLPLVTPPAEAIVMAGWKQAGQVTVRSHPGLAYRELWDSTRHVVLWLLAALGLILPGLILLVARVVRPLRAVARQAGAVCERRFPIIEPVPRIPELGQVVQAMNRMVGRVQGMLEALDSQARTLREEAYVDALTGLANRRGFEVMLDQRLGDGEDNGPGALLLLRLGGLDEMNRRHGRAQVDLMLRNVASALQHEMDDGPEAVLARPGGAEFTLLCPGCGDRETRDRAQQVIRAVLQAVGTVADTLPVHLGVAPYHPGDTRGAILARVDSALRRAEQGARHDWQVFEARGADAALQSLGVEEWWRHLGGVLANERIVLHCQPVLAAGSDRELHREVYARIPDPGIGQLAAGQFLPMAERLGMGAAFDRLVLSRVAALMERDGDVRCAVNLSPASLLDDAFSNWLYGFLARRAPVCKRLSLEFSENMALHHQEALRDAGPRLCGLGLQLGLDRFGNTAGALACLRSLKVNYVKIDGGYIRDIDADRDRQFLVGALLNIAHGLDTQVIGSYVENNQDRRRLAALGVDGVQGFAVAAVTEWN